MTNIKIHKVIAKKNTIKYFRALYRNVSLKNIGYCSANNFVLRISALWFSHSFGQIVTDQTNRPINKMDIVGCPHLVYMCVFKQPCDTYTTHIHTHTQTQNNTGPPSSGESSRIYRSCKHLLKYKCFRQTKGFPQGFCAIKDYRTSQSVERGKSVAKGSEYSNSCHVGSCIVPSYS